jgi:hypothetical protein
LPDGKPQPDLRFGDLIVKSIWKAQPLTVAAHAAKAADLQNAIDEISYMTAARLDQAGEPPDPLMAPWHVLGVRLAEEARAVA